MASQAFIRASAAAAIGGVSVAQLGCSYGYEFPTKEGLINSGGAFDANRLTNYRDEDFVLERDVVLGTILVELQMNSDVSTRGTVQLDDSQSAPSVAVLCTQGQTVTAKCILSDASDVFLGWYDSQDALVSSNQNYSFSVSGAISLTAKVAYMDLSTDTMTFGYEAASAQVSIQSNSDWSLS